MSAALHRKLAAYRKAAETGLVAAIAPEFADEAIADAVAQRIDDLRHGRLANDPAMLRGKSILAPVLDQLDEAQPTPDFAVRETPTELILTPRPRVATNRHGRYDISTARGQAQARHFMLTCTDPDASIHFVCPGGDIASAMREVLGEQATPAEPETVAITHHDPDRWHRAIGLTLVAIGGALVWWAILILCGVAK